MNSLALQQATFSLRLRGVLWKRFEEVVTILGTKESHESRPRFS